MSNSDENNLERINVERVALPSFENIQLVRDNALREAVNRDLPDSEDASSVISGSTTVSVRSRRNANSTISPESKSDANHGVGSVTLSAEQFQQFLNALSSAGSKAKIALTFESASTGPRSSIKKTPAQLNAANVKKYKRLTEEDRTVLRAEGRCFYCRENVGPVPAALSVSYECEIS
eukprot:Rmarinus@m.27685